MADEIIEIVVDAPAPTDNARSYRPKQKNNQSKRNNATLTPVNNSNVVNNVSAASPVDNKHQKQQSTASPVDNTQQKQHHTFQIPQHQSASEGEILHKLHDNGEICSGDFINSLTKTIDAGDWNTIVNDITKSSITKPGPF